MISQESPSLCVCIITYQRPEGLRRLLDALVPQIKKRPGRSVVVVNDGSHDDAYFAVAENFSAIARYHRLEQFIDNYDEIQELLKDTPCEIFLNADE